MSNTGRSKRLASFNCDTELWEKFMRQCRDNGTTATDALTTFISHYLNGSLDKLAVKLGEMTAKGKGDWQQQVKALVDEYLEQQLPAYLDKYNITNVTEPISRPERKLTTPRKEKELWFARERAKYLGIEINASQLIHIELRANDAFKERHGTPPKKQLFRGTQSSVYPKEDVDILDKAIKKVVEG